MTGTTRAVATLLAVAVAGALGWLSTQLGDGSTGRYWAIYGLLAAAGLVLALSQMRGVPRFSPSVFLLAFLPALIVVAWIAAYHQPNGNWARGHVLTWTADIGLAQFVVTMGGVLELLAVGLGAVLGFTLLGERVAVPATAAYDRRAADEPLSPDRQVVESRPRERMPLATTPAGRQAPEE